MNIVLGDIFICQAAIYTRVGYDLLVHLYEDWVG